MSSVERKLVENKVQKFGPLNQQVYCVKKKLMKRSFTSSSFIVIVVLINGFSEVNLHDVLGPLVLKCFECFIVG